MSKEIKKKQVAVKETKKTTVNIRGSRTKKYSSPFHIVTDKTNFALLFAGIAVIIIGFILLGVGEWDSSVSLVVAPILLFIAYFIIFPASIFYKKREVKEDI